MAEDKQLTVAELLARNKAEREARGDAPRRRRRRSLEEGGISVAELTGNINKVDVKPAQAKHSSVDIDESAPVIPAPKKPEEKAPEKPAEKPAAKAAEKPAAKPAERPAEKPAAAATPADDSTTVIKKVEAPAKKAEAKPAETKPAEAKPAEAKPVKEKTEDAETGVIPVVTDASAQPAAKTPAKVDEKADAKAEAKVDAKADEKADVKAADAAATDAADAGADADAVDEYEDEHFEEDSKTSPVAVVLLALVGIVLGAVVFKGFEVLWGSMNGALVAVLALVVTGVMVGVVHALRTNTDKLSMGLAAVVGLVLTFGPLLVV